MRHFSADVLAIIVLLNMFLQLMVRPKGILLERCDCFDLLHQIISLLTQRDELTEAVYHKMSTVVDKHAHLFRKLYPDAIKIKFPHLLHIPTGLWDLGIFISCFVTERMHKDLKLAVLFVYRNVEHTTTSNWVNWYMQECISGRSKFQRNIMKIPILRHAPDGTPFYFAREMVMHILTGHVGDIAMVSLDDRSTFCVGRILGFYSVSLSKADLNDAYVEVELFSALGDF